MAKALIHVFTVRCPVGDEILGYRPEGRQYAVLCEDCQFVYTWDRRGSLLPPEKFKIKKCVACGCSGCGR